MSLNSLGLGFVFKAKDMASGQMRKLERNFKSLDDTSEETQKRFSSNASKMALGLGLMGAGAIGMRSLGPAVTEARSFGKAIGEVSTLVDEAAFSTAQMKDITMSMAETYGIDALQQAPALYQTISAGISDAGEATKLMATANKLAIGGVTDMTTSVDGLTTAVNAYAASNLTAEDAADTMFVAIKAGKTTAAELSSTLGRVAPTAESLGVSFAELSAGLAAITTKGISTKEAVTGMKAAFANVLKPTSDAEKEAKRLGIAFDAGALRAQGFTKFLGNITSASKFNEDSLAKLFGSVEALNAILALTSNDGSKFKEVLGMMETRTGAADEAFKKMNKTFDAQMNRLGASTKNFKIMVGEALVPLIKVLAFAISGLVSGFMALPGPVRSAIVIGFALGSALLFVAGLVIFLKAAFAALAILKVGAMFLVAAKGAMAFAAALLANPIVWIAAAIIAAIIAIIYYWDEVSAALEVVGGVFAKIAKFIWKVYSGLFKAIFKGWVMLFGKMGGVLKGLWNTAKSIAGSIAGVFTSVAGTIVSVWTTIIGALTPVFNFIRGIISSIGDFIEKVVGKVTWLIDKAKSVGGFIKDAGGSAFDFVTETVNPFSDDFLELPSGGGGGSLTGGIKAQNLVQSNPALAALSASNTHRGSQQPIILNSKTIVDGEVVGQSQKKYMADERNRSFSSNLGEDD